MPYVACICLGLYLVSVLCDIIGFWFYGCVIFARVRYVILTVDEQQRGFLQLHKTNIINGYMSKSIMIAQIE